METPISVLQDFCGRHLEGRVPEYQLLSSECLAKPTFVYRVEIAGVVASAPGQSKKKAKHAAAMAALQMLLKRLPDPVASSYIEKWETTLEGGVVPQEGLPSEIEVNSVGKLQELCMKKRWRPPAYETFEELMDNTHERLFHMDCHVITNDGVVYKSQGTGRSKKLAKRSAAIEMLSQLDGQGLLPPNFLGSGTSGSVSTNHHAKNNSNASPSYNSSFKPIPVGGVVHAGDKCIDFYESIGDELNEELNPYLQTPQKDPFDSLQMVADFLECHVKYEVLPSNQEEVFLSIASLVPLDSFHYPIPVVGGWGMGSSQKEADKNAAAKALEMFNSIRYIKHSVRPGKTAEESLLNQEESEVREGSS